MFLHEPRDPTNRARADEAFETTADPCTLVTSTEPARLATPVHAQPLVRMHRIEFVKGHRSHMRSRDRRGRTRLTTWSSAWIRLRAGLEDSLAINTRLRWMRFGSSGPADTLALTDGAPPLHAR